MRSLSCSTPCARHQCMRDAQFTGTVRHAGISGRRTAVTNSRQCDICFI